MKSSVARVITAACIFAAGFAARGVLPMDTTVEAQAGPKVFELRTYTAPAGKLGDLHARFRNHTQRIFARHGMTSVGYWRPADSPLADNTLIYIITHTSREAAKANWDAFRADPEWVKVAADSQVNGRIVEKVESVFMTAADYSPLK